MLVSTKFLAFKVTKNATKKELNMKNFNKFMLMVILASLVLAMLVTGLYAIFAICASLSGADGNILDIFLMLLTGIASGFVCYALHKITF